MNQRNQDRFGSSSYDRDQDRDDGPRRSSDGYGGGWSEDGYRGGALRGSSSADNVGERAFHGQSNGRNRFEPDTGSSGERFGTQGYGMSDYGYGNQRGAREYDMRDYNDGRGRDFGNDDGRWQQRDFASSDFRVDRGQGQGRMDSYGGSRNGGDDRWNMPGRGGQGELRGSNDFRSQSWRGDDRSASQGSYGLRDGMLGHGYGSYGDGSRQKGGRSGYADVSDFGRGGGSGIDYGASANRGNQDFSHGRGDARSFGGPKNYKRSDERIREDLCDRLQHLASQGHLDPTDIDVTVKDGEVTLTGTVPQRDWKHRAEDLAEAVSGVKDVDNRIRVQRRDSTGLSSSPGSSSTPSSGKTASPTATGVAGNGSTTANAKS